MSKFGQLLVKFIEDQDADAFLFSGEITAESASQFIDDIHEERDKSGRKNFCLFLCTGGGDPDAGFKIAKYIKKNYEKFTLYICGFCKSTGTLIALSADEIVMSAQGELGPLDTQTSKRDELFFQSSSLDLLTAFEYLGDQSKDLFEKHFISLILQSNGAITIKTAADIAGRLTNGLLEPILGQIEPLRLGEIQREVKIAADYGMRLCKDQNVVNALIYNYPSHSFVIDLEEAKKVFDNVISVREFSEEEAEFKVSLATLLKGRFGVNSLRTPAPNLLSINLGGMLNAAKIAATQTGEAQNEQENQSYARAEQGDMSGNGAPDPPTREVSAAAPVD